MSEREAVPADAVRSELSPSQIIVQMNSFLSLIALVVTPAPGQHGRKAAWEGVR